MSNLILNGTAVGNVTIRPVNGSVASERRTLDHDGRDQIYFRADNRDYVATGDSLHIDTYPRNILMQDGRRVQLLATDNQIDSVSDVTHQVYRRLPSLNNKYTIVGTGVVAGAAAGLISGSVRTGLRAGVATAGVLAVGAVTVSYMRARHPEWFQGLLK